jgi:hypothetical protein
MSTPLQPLLASQVILQRCLPQGWVARIIFPPYFVLYLVFLRFNKHPYHLAHIPLQPFEKYTIRYVLGHLGKREGKVGYYTICQALCFERCCLAMDYPFWFLRRSAGVLLI